MKVMVVDDEPLARSRLVRLLENLGGCEVVAEAGNGAQAVEQWQQHRPDVVLMDIRMPVMDGLNAARELAGEDEPPAVIFCTAYDDYAVQAFDANAVGYLLKPVNQTKLADALAKAQKLNRVQLNSLAGQNAEQRSHISARSLRGVTLIAITDVRYCVADQKYVTVYYVQDGQLAEVLIDEPLRDLESSFADQLVRVHRSALVSVAHLQGLEKTALGFRVKLAGVAEGPLVSRRHLAALRSLMESL